MRRQHDCDVVALHDADGDALRACAAHHGIGRRCADFDELLATGVDFVILAGPPEARLPQVRAAAEQAVPCLLHVPMAAGLGDAEAMVLEAERHEVRLGLAVPGMHDPLLDELRGMIASGWLGAPVAVHGSAGSVRGTQAGSPLLLQAAHLVHLTTWLTGLPAVSVTSQHSNTLPGLPADAAAATAELGGGALATYVVTPRPGGDVLSVHGSDGWLVLQHDHIGLCGRVEHRGALLDYLTPGVPVWIERSTLTGTEQAGTRTELHGRFARWLVDEDAFPCPADQALRDLRTLDAMARAAATGRRELVR